MPVTQFYRGTFRTDLIKGSIRTVEWDGTNEQDICDWINDTITNHPAITFNSSQYSGWTEWTASVDNGIATFTGWRGRSTDAYGSFPTKSVQAAQGDWLSAWDLYHNSTNVGGPFNVVGKEYMWQTQDPGCRPENVEDVFAPGTTFPWI